jgi:hypothetical protein
MKCYWNNTGIICKGQQLQWIYSFLGFETMQTDVSKEPAASLHVITRRQYLQTGPQNLQHSPQQISIFIRMCWMFVLITGFKQKLSQCTKALEGWSITPLILGDVNFTNRPPYYGGKSPWYLYKLRLYGLHRRSECLEMRRFYCRLVGCPACSLVRPAPLQGLYIHFTHTNIRVKHYARWSRQLLLLLLLLYLIITIITTTTISRSLSQDRSTASSKVSSSRNAIKCFLFSLQYLLVSVRYPIAAYVFCLVLASLL